MNKKKIQMQKQVMKTSSRRFQTMSWNVITLKSWLKIFKKKKLKISLKLLKKYCKKLKKMRTIGKAKFKKNLLKLKNSGNPIPPGKKTANSLLHKLVKFTLRMVRLMK
jgi:hypothetical protein